MTTRVLAAICAALLLAGCGSAEDQGRIEFGPKPLFDPVVLPTNSLKSAIVPLPFDGLYGTELGQDDNPDNNLDGTLAPAGSLAGLPNWGLIDGWSTTATMMFNLVGAIDVASAGDGIRIFDSATFRELIPGEDFSVEQSPLSITSPRLLVHWLKPLNESTRYLVGLTTDLKGPGGGSAIPNELFAALNNATPFSEQGNTIAAGLASLDPNGAAKIATLDALQSQLVLPVVNGLTALSAAAPNSRGVIAADDLVMAWSFTTQSIRPTMASLVASAQPQQLGVIDSQLDVSQALSGNPAEPLPLPPGADGDVYVGSLTLPYYQKPGAENITTTVWENDGTVSAATHPALGAPCAALLPPTSTTICYPTPAKQADVTVPVLLVRPHGEMPAGGWPVAVFMHGLGQDRSNLLAIAPALSQAGVVVIGIDHPLHGVAANSPLRVPGTTERHFDADLDGDGNIDASGIHSVNLTNPATLRDHSRQGVIDQIHLVMSLPNLRLGPDFSETVNADRVHVIGHSLGGIAGSMVLGAIDADTIGASSLAMPGGGFMKLLDGSEALSSPIVAGLGAAGIDKGTDTYEIFLRFAQLVVDAGDPINWATTATDGGNRNVHLMEVVGDTVVPNSGLQADGALTIIDGHLSGTRPLATAMGLPLVEIDPPVASLSVLESGGHIRFASGNHGSILQPTTANPADDAVYVEMQREVANFIASGGACLPIGGNCPQP